jgi:hypothetical protein
LNGDEDSSIIRLAKEVGELTGEMKGMRTELTKGIETFQNHVPNCDLRLTFFGPPDNPKMGYKYFLDQLREGRKFALRLTWKQLFAMTSTIVGFLAAYLDRDTIIEVLKRFLSNA